MVLISTNTFWTIWLFVHLILAVGLIGALTHQAMSVALPVRQSARGIATRFRGVPAAGYATAVCLLWVLTFIVGSLIYTKYRTYIRIPLEAAHFYKSGGFFDFKEHVASIGLMLLPAYWYFWKNANNREYDNARKGVTLVLAIMACFCSSSATLSTTPGDSDHDERDDNDYVSAKASHIVAGGFPQIWSVRYKLLHFQPGCLLPDAVSQLPAVYVSSGDKSHRVGL